MCGRFVQVIDIDQFIKRFGIEKPFMVNVTSSYNVAPGDRAYVISNTQPNRLMEMTFGFTPQWASKQMYLINARAEGDLNPNNETTYNGPLGIVNKPSFRTAIKSQRCLVIANAFYEGPAKEKLSKPYKISRKDDEIFCFAGIWDTWADNNTGELVYSFSIITTVSNEATQKIGHPRSPVILNKKDERKWLDTTLTIEEVLALLKPFPGELLKTEPVSIQIKDPKNKNRDLVIELGKDQISQFEINIDSVKRTSGEANKKRKEDPPVQQTLF